MTNRYLTSSHGVLALLDEIEHGRVEDDLFTLIGSWIGMELRLYVGSSGLTNQ